jgi:cell division protein FtsI (penicillin-binding protein 3)
MDVNNGDILSLVSLPNFNINQRSNIKDKNLLIKLQKVFMSLAQFLKLLQ